MEFAHSALLAVGLFALTFLSPGPNLLVVLQSSLSAGRAAGIATGLGVAVGDAVYAGLGLSGVAAVITAGGLLFSVIKILGGAYLIWIGIRLLLNSKPMQLDFAFQGTRLSLARHFRRGLVTDLANPQTVLFFASIFSVTLNAATPLWAKIAAWAGIVATSMVWRAGLSHAFSLPWVRRGYVRVQRSTERLAGIALGAFGARLVSEGVSHR
jgi:amino acid exporter